MKAEDKSLYDIDNREIDVDEFRELVAKNAYYRAEKRGFEDGYELEDWLKAEQEVSNQSGY
ncbi:MAG: DUF2934 domain-containing protein [Methylococcaceae bacterium]